MKGFVRSIVVLAAAAALFMAGCSLVPGASGIIYVGTNGTTNGTGTITDPQLDLTVAIEMAVNTGVSNIYVGAGVYTAGKGLRQLASSGVFISAKTNVNISGGWNDTFTIQTGESILDAEGATDYRVVLLIDSENITFDKISIINGNAGTGDFGGGLFITNSANISVKNCVITNNTAIRGGGAYILDGSLNVFDACVIANNNVTTTYTAGGGIFFRFGTDNGVINSIITNNKANSGIGGGVAVSRGTNTLIAGNTIVYNTASADFAMFIGGGVGDNTANGLFNLIVSNNVFGGVNTSSGYGIGEEYDIGATFINISGHTLVDNKFATNLLSHLYRNTTGANATADIDTIANLTIANTGAAVASGNVATNW